MILYWSQIIILSSQWPRMHAVTNWCHRDATCEVILSMLIYRSHSCLDHSMVVFSFSILRFVPNSIFPCFYIILALCSRNNWKPDFLALYKTVLHIYNLIKISDGNGSHWLLSTSQLLEPMTNKVPSPFHPTDQSGQC